MIPNLVDVDDQKDETVRKYSVAYKSSSVGATTQHTDPDTVFMSKTVLQFQNSLPCPEFFCVKTRNARPSVRFFIAKLKLFL